MTNARDLILAAVRAARPPAVPAPLTRTVVGTFSRPEGHTDRRFTAAASAAGAEVIGLQRAGIADAVMMTDAATTSMLSSIPDVASSIALPSDLRMLRDLDRFVCEARLGVAENGAVWLTTPNSFERAALFLALHVVVVLDRAAIVEDLHAAYAQLQIGSDPFGIFVAGPSKTADIEQSLVIGAQGPKRFTILLV